MKTFSFCRRFIFVNFILLDSHLYEELNSWWNGIFLQQWTYSADVEIPFCKTINFFTVTTITKSDHLIPTLSQFNPVHILQTYFCKIIFNIILLRGVLLCLVRMSYYYHTCYRPSHNLLEQITTTQVE
jgi:hypothetical protein